MSLRQNEDLIATLSADSSDLSVWDTVAFALGFLSRHWLRLVGIAAFPLFLSAVVLCLALGGYLSELERFQGAPSPKTAGLALAELAAGIFAALFSFSTVVVSIAELLDGRAPARPWYVVRVHRQQWRLYAAYLKFLVAIGVLFALVGAAGMLASPYLPIWLPISAATAGAFSIYVRTAFLFPPLILSERGPIVRRAWHISRSDAWRIALIVFLLSLPGLAAEMASEYALRLTGLVRLSPGITLTDYAPGVKRVLPGFLFGMTLWSFFSATLLTAGAAAVYRALSPGRGQAAR